MNWYNVSIGQGQEIVRLLTADLDRLDKEIYLCSVIFKKPIEYFETMPREQLLKWIEKSEKIKKSLSSSLLVFDAKKKVFMGDMGSVRI